MSGSNFLLRRVEGHPPYRRPPKRPSWSRAAHPVQASRASYRRSARSPVWSSPPSEGRAHEQHSADQASRAPLPANWRSGQMRLVRRAGEIRASPLPIREGGCFVSASAPHAARGRRQSEAELARISVSSTWLRRGSLRLGDPEQWFHPLGRNSRGGGSAANVPSAGPDHPLSAPRRPGVPPDVRLNAQRRGSCPQHFRWPGPR